jgi:hypothetical protein
MSELQTPVSPRWRWYHFWPVAIPALVLVAAYASALLNASVFERLFRMDEKAEIDDYAPYVVLVPAALYWVRCMVTRNPLYTVMMVASATLLLRELHWDPAMKVAAYPILIGCFVWMFIWSDILAEPFKRDRKHTIMLIATLVAYLFAQSVEKRIVKFELAADIDKYRDGVDVALAQAQAIMGEGFGSALRVVDDQLHSKFEELAEMVANAMLGIAALIGSWRYCDRNQKFIPLSEGFAKSPSKAMLDKLKPGKSKPRKVSGFVPDLGEEGNSKPQ